MKNNKGYLFIAVAVVMFSSFEVMLKFIAGQLNSLQLTFMRFAIGFIFLGTLLKNDLVWELTDFFNYLMVLPNAIALIALSSVVAKASKGKAEKK